MEAYTWMDTYNDSWIVNPLDKASLGDVVAPIYGKVSVRPLGAEQPRNLYFRRHGMGLVLRASPCAILAIGSPRYSEDNASLPRSIQSVLGLECWKYAAYHGSIVHIRPIGQYNSQPIPWRT